MNGNGQERTKGGGPERPRAVVIGSGFGGLAAAVRLGARGYRVTVLERRDRPGGRAYVYREG
ncbi:MAG TPA: FAD-dependent oxidoreductase, partial [Polyangiaceae bacterium]|nr:FAD-dependent oxidoreductase [Polyangiaceae bacterium]